MPHLPFELHCLRLLVAYLSVVILESLVLYISVVRLDYIHVDMYSYWPSGLARIVLIHLLPYYMIVTFYIVDVDVIMI